MHSIDILACESWIRARQITIIKLIELTANEIMASSNTNTIHCAAHIVVSTILISCAIRPTQFTSNARKVRAGLVERNKGN